MADSFDELIGRGNEARLDDRPEDARRAFADAAWIAHAENRDADLALARQRQAQIERDLGEFAAALAFQQEAVALRRKAGDDDRLAHALRHLAEILDEAGDRQAAAGPMAEMLAIYRRTAHVDPLDLANALRSAAAHAEAMSDVAAARRLWTEAGEVYGTLDARFLELTGRADNPGVREAARRLAGLGDGA